MDAAGGKPHRPFISAKESIFLTMDKQMMAEEIYKLAHWNGEVRMRSGATSDNYVDPYRFESDPRLMGAIAWEMSTFVPVGTNVLAGLELGGIPLVTVLSLETRIPAVFVRLKAQQYGTGRVAEGAEIAGKRVCVIKDLVSTGTQVLQSVNDLRAAGANVTDVICVIAQDPEGRRNIEAEGIRFHALFTIEELTRIGLGGEEGEPNMEE
ncbi:orotate phosphoribosyltransferase [Paenibacillus aurantiacus]|uniref:Orotate phosphoribosyltransferase n=1 Tax=Paenibacillus aurantiacus TaxID=1936118 RepID=A0ABV5L0E8_9BACL